MNVSINASKSDQGTEHLAASIRPHLDAVSSILSGEYGGPIDHLWTDLELSPGDADRRPAFPFRFQRRVTASREMT